MRDLNSDLIACRPFRIGFDLYRQVKRKANDAKAAEKLVAAEAVRLEIATGQIADGDLKMTQLKALVKGYKAANETMAQFKSSPRRLLKKWQALRSELPVLAGERKGRRVKKKTPKAAAKAKPAGTCNKPYPLYVIHVLYACTRRAKFSFLIYIRVRVLARL